MKDQYGGYTGSAKRLNKNGCTSSRVSGPPRFNKRTPIFPSSFSGEVDTLGVSEVSTARNGNEDLVSGGLKVKDCVPDQPNVHLGTMGVFEKLAALLPEISIWIIEQ